MSLEDLRITLFASKGLDPRIISSSELLRAALDAENTSKDLGPCDPAFEHFVTYSHNAFEAAIIAENLGR